MAGLLVTVFGIVLSCVGGLLPSPLVTIIGAIIGIAGAIAQHRHSQPYVVVLDRAAWKELPNGDYQLVIPRRSHQKSEPAVEFLINERGNWNLAEPGVETTPEGSVVITAHGRPYGGKIVIR